MAALVFTFVDNPEKITPFDHEAMASRLKENDSSLAIFVLAVLCKIFSYADYRSILESHLAKRKKENNPPLKYILQQALDALNPNDPEVTKLTAELKCPPLLSHFATLSEWQFGLDKLLNYSKILKKPTSKISRARIVYLVDIDTFDIQPYRQKSKDGITWSKGTAVSMSSFAEMLPEMDEADQIAAAKVVRVNSRVARLRGVEVLYELADTGRTFLMLEPEVPFEIHRDRLRIEVKKDSGGSYETTTNIDFATNLRTDPHYAFELDGSILTIYKINRQRTQSSRTAEQYPKTPR